MKTVVFLEPKGTILEVVRTAKELGHRVVCVVSDRSLLSSLPVPYDSAVGCIDEIMQIPSWNDSGIVERLVQNVKSIDGVYFGVDACAVIGAALRKRMGLPTTTPDAMTVILDKHAFRKKLADAGVSHLRSYPGSIADRLQEWPFRGAAYFKPVHGSFSMYVTLCKNLEDLSNAKRSWQSGNLAVPKFLSDFLLSKPEYHLEEAFEGELMSVEAISHRGEFSYLGLTSRILYSKNPVVEMGSCFPYPHPIEKKIVDTVKKAHGILGFTDGPSHTEVIVNSVGEVEIIDFNPRFIGADVLQSINYAYGIRIQESLLSYALGEYTEPARPTDHQFSCLQYFLPPHPLTLTSVAFPQAPEVRFSTCFLRLGTEIKETNRQIDYVGCYLTVMPTFTDALRRSKELRTQVLLNVNVVPAY